MERKDTEMECLKQAFALFDRDRDGEINKENILKNLLSWKFSNFIRIS